jgi:hypothetical protein
MHGQTGTGPHVRTDRTSELTGSDPIDLETEKRKNLMLVFAFR